MKKPNCSRSGAICLIFLSWLFAGPANAASISLLPSSSDVNLADGTATLELFMDFTGEGTLGGGLDFALFGPIGDFSFSPSAFFNTETDPFFTGFGTDTADADFEIHFGSSNFATGLEGVNKLGDVTVSLLGLGASSIEIAINSTWGNFVDLQGAQQMVDLNGAQLNAVPIPAVAWLFPAGLIGGLGWMRRSSSK